MSVNTQVIVIKDDTPSVLPPPSSRSSLRRRKPMNPEDFEMTQLNRQALLDRIRTRRHPCQCRRDEPQEIAFGKKVLNKQLSKSVNDVKEVVGQLRKSSSSHGLAIPTKCSWCNFDDLRVEFRSSRAHTLIDLTEAADLTPEIAIYEEKEKEGESKTCKVVELHEKPQSETLKTTGIPKKPEDLVEESKPTSPKRILKRQLSKSVNDISISGGHFGLKVIGSEKIALSQIWTVQTNCGCCEPGKEGDCKRLKVQELRQKFTKEEVSPVKPKTLEIPKAGEKVEEKIPECSKAKPEILVNTAKTTEVPNAPKEVIKESTKLVIAAICAKTTQPEKFKAPEIPKTQEVVKASTNPAIPANPTKTIEPEKPKVAEAPKPKEVVQETGKPVIPAKPAEPVKPEATPTDAAEVDEDANIIVKVLTWMGFWSTTKPAEPSTTTATATTTTTTTVIAAKPTTTTTTAAVTAAKPTTITAPITTTTAATITVPTTTASSTSKIESPPKPTNSSKPDDTTSEPKWVELQVPVVPREGIAKDANESSTKSIAKVLSHLYLNVLVEAGSGMISIIPVASYELLIKTSVVVWDTVMEEDHEEVKQQFDMYTGPTMYFAFS